VKERTTVLSDCRKYRYILWRTAPPDDFYAMFIGVNPSTADEVSDDPTIRKCRHFTKAWGFDSLCMVNLFAYRSTDPSVLRTTADEIIGPENDEWIKKAAQGAAVIVAAWGNNGNLSDRDVAVRALLKDFNVQCLGTTRDGSPKHPLYLKNSTELVSF
jgi:hypothetical protein